MCFNLTENCKPHPGNVRCFAQTSPHFHTVQVSWYHPPPPGVTHVDQAHQ